MLRLAEAAERLGFVVVDHGDIGETPLDETFAEASFQARKEIFTPRVRRVPIVNWLDTMLQAADRHELEADVIQSALGLEFPLRIPRSSWPLPSTGGATRRSSPTITAVA